MKRSERDFVALFYGYWYKSFPIASGHEDLGKRAFWTIHIGSVVKQCADSLGYFTCFESGGRTDAVIQTASRRIWAKIEWEWKQPHHSEVNELSKLAIAAKEKDDAKRLIYIGYSREEDLHENIKVISKAWRYIKRPLLTFLVTYERRPGYQRYFKSLQTYYFRASRHQLVRNQAALPWNLKDTVWQNAKKSLALKSEKKNS